MLEDLAHIKFSDDIIISILSDSAVTNLLVTALLESIDQILFLTSLTLVILLPLAKITKISIPLK